MLIDYTGKWPEFTVAARRVPEFAAVESLKKTDVKLHRACMLYLYFVFDKDSPYEKMLIHDKHKVLNKDYLGDLIPCGELEKNKTLIAAAEKFVLLSYTAKERFILAWNNKVANLVKIWGNMKSETEEEQLKSARLLQQIKPLLEFKEHIDKQKDDASEEELYGGGKAGLFELDEAD